MRDKIVRTKPYRCGMVPSHYCNEMLSIWTFGSKGHCGSPHAGFRIGVNGYKYAAIQVRSIYLFIRHTKETYNVFIHLKTLLKFISPEIITKRNILL